jgi:PKD repeat protein
MSLPDVLKGNDALKSDGSTSSSPRNRRDFLRTVAGGAAAGAAVTAAGCDSAGGDGGGNQSPTAFFSAQPEEEESLTITFNAGDSEDPDGSIADYSWDFGGDGKRAQSEEESESDETVTYTYARPGVYEVRLVVADRRGGVARTTQQVTAGSVDTGEGPVPLNLDTDLGVLNYAYALEQLEAAFYARVLDEGTFSGSAEAVMSDLAAHEDIHRLTLESVLQTAAIRDLTPDFGDVDFNSTGSVLSAAQTFEVLGVSAYNGAADLLSSAEFLGAAGSIVSVEARHAAAVRDLAGASDHFFSGPFPVGGGFAIDDDGLYEARDPREVLDAAAPYIEERFDVQGG